MAYTATIDEYRGDAFNYRSAGYRDAPAGLGYTLFHLAQGATQAAYGALASASDVDLYRLGWLVPGLYTFQVSAYGWTSGSAIAATAVPSLELLNASGAPIPATYSTTGRVSFAVSEPGDFQIRLASPTGVLTQYKLSYAFAADRSDVAATGSLGITGNPTEGQTLTANYSFSDLDGVQHASPEVQWYAYTAATAKWLPVADAKQATYLLSARDVGAKLAYTVSFIDDQGYLETLASSVPTGTVTAAAVLVDTVAPVTPRWSSLSHWHYAINPRVTLTTSLGPIELELSPNQASITVDNWLAYVNSRFLDGLIFHRVIKDFMVQGGGLDPNWVQQAPSYAPVVLESNNGLHNVRGALAMARTSVAESATSQFFINLVDNPFLDFGNPKALDPNGYAVFGHVLSGMDVVDQIAKVSTGTVAGMSDVPLVETLIQSAVQSGAGLAYTSSTTLFVDGLEASGHWAYSLDAGLTWHSGVGSSVSLPAGHYAAGDIRLRQWDAAGQVCTVDGVVGNALVVDVSQAAGHVYQWKSHALLADVQLDWVASEFPASVVLKTGADGRYANNDLAGAKWSLTASKNVSTADAAAITTDDALVALKIAAGRNPNADGSPLSPYQFMAADVNDDGRVTSADALAILKMALHRSDAPAAQWVFVDEAQNFWNEAANAFFMTRSAVAWLDSTGVDGAQSPSHNLVAVLKGDVNGSWSAPPDAIDLDSVYPDYFAVLAATLQVPVTQWV